MITGDRELGWKYRDLILKQIKEELHRTNKILERVVESLERRNAIEEAVRELASEGKDETTI